MSNVAPAIDALDLRGTYSCASFQIRRTARAITSLYDAVFEDCGIRSTQFGILVAICKEQPICIGDLSLVMLIDRTTLTRSLRLLQKQKLVTVSARSSMRQRFVTLTPEGDRILARALPLWRAMQERFLAAVGSDHWQSLQRELQELSKVSVRLESPHQ
jgi:DNA-binding MarR family transcriptional regulator